MKFFWHKADRPSGYQEIPESLWSSWHWQLRSSLTDEEHFSQSFVLSENEKAAFRAQKGIFRVSTTPYYAGLARQTTQDPIRRIFMPGVLELSPGNQSLSDPLNEKNNNPVSRVIHI